MKKLYTRFFGLFVLLLALCAPGKVQASHVMGADVTWKCVGGDTFLITVTAYRDCNGINLSGGGIELKCSDGSAVTIQAGGNLGPALDITPVCKKSCTRCNKPGCEFQFGIEQNQITATVVLDKSKCCEYNISWQQCCRNGAITTGASGANFYCEAKMNICQTPCDNSPYFTNPPVAIFCKGQCVVLNPGANDDDRDGNGEADSLVYKFAKPLSGAGSEIPYGPGYSYDAPLKYTGDKDAEFNPPKCEGFHLDPETGDLSFKASKEDQTVVALTIEEWRKDKFGVPKKIGEIRRDLQIAIIECPDNRSPQVVVEDNKSMFYFCVNKGKCISFKSFDQDPNDSITLSWNRQIRGGTFTVADKTKKWPTAQFCWTPKKSDVRSLPHQFVVTAIDDACPVPGRTTKTIRIVVFPEPQATIQKTIDKCGWVTFKAFPTGEDNHSDYQYTWAITGNKRPNGTTDFALLQGNPVKYKYTGGGTFKYTLSVENRKTTCNTIYPDSVKIDNYVGIDLPKDTTVCVGTALKVKAVRRSGFPNFTYKWNLGSAYDDKLEVTLAVTKDTTVRVDVFDGSGCDNYDEMKITAQKPPVPKLGADLRLCKGDTAFLNTTLNNMKTYNWYMIQNDGSLAAVGTNKIFKATDSGDYVVHVFDNLGCNGLDTIKVRFNPQVDVKRQIIHACRNESLTLSVGNSGTIGDKWEWRDQVRPQIGVFNTASTYNIAKLTANEYHFTVKATQTIMGVTCQDYDTIDVIVHNKPVPKVNPLPALCINNPPIVLTQFGSPVPIGGNSSWAVIGYPNAIIGNTLNPALLGKGTFDVAYTVTDQFGCAGTFVAQLVVDTLPKIYTYPDSVICRDLGPLQLKAYPQGGLWSGKGVVGTTPDQQVFNPKDPAIQAGAPVSLTYKYTDTKSAKCSSEEPVIFTVLATPDPKATQPSPYCDENDPNKFYVLTATPAGGKWMADTGVTLPAGALVKSGADFRFYPTKAGPGSYRLRYELYTNYMGKDYCGKFDVMTVKVMPLPVITLKTGDNLTQYCVNHAPVALTVTTDQPGGQMDFKIDGGTNGLLGSGGNTRLDPSKLTPGKHNVTFTYRSPEGCTKSTTLQVEIFPEPEVTIVTDNSFCEGDIAHIVASVKNADKYTWEVVNNAVLVGSANGLEADFKPNTNVTKFRVKITVEQAGNPCGTREIEKEFKVNPKPVAKFEANTLQGCGPLTVRFTSNTQGADKYIWDFGDFETDTTNLETITHTYAKPGVYTVKMRVFTNKGCTDELSKPGYITVFETPVADFRAKPQYTSIAMPKIEFFSEPYTTGAGEGATYDWNFGDHNVTGGGYSNQKNPIHEYSDTGKYTVSLRVRNPNGCEGDTVKLAYVDIRPELIVFIPNAFSPDGMNVRLTGGKNEKFTVVITYNATFTMLIYDRWGQEIYATHDPAAGWDGTFKGKEVQEGVYVYVVKATSLAGKEYTYTGTVTLLK